uniref:Coronin n=2 Tax=Telluraves TaxID=3073808 RepID=A0A674GFD0_TAEGU
MRDLHKSEVLGSKRGLMSWRPQYRSSKFRNVYGKAASREHCFDGIPITKNVHDNHFCAVNVRFLAIVTESAGGGSFLVIPLEQTGRIEPNYPKVCGHQGNVLDIKWNPFIENIIASCSEDTSVRIWEIPEGGLKRNMTEAVLELYGHSRRVGLVEWHPTTNNILFSAGYDYKVLIWNLDIGEPVKMIDCHTDVILCMSFNTDGSLLATTCKDKKLRVLEPRSGRVLQEASCKNHRVNRVVFLGSTKRLLTTGVSRWNTRQIALWDQEDLSMPLIEEEIDGLSGLLFPFYDADTHMLYLAGKGDGNIRYYEISSEKPYLSYLMEFRSPAPQKGLGVMPKHGLDVSACEVFRFYKLITLKGLIEPISMIVPRRSETYQEDIYPMTPGTEPALTPDEWLSGVNRGKPTRGYPKNIRDVGKGHHIPLIRRLSRRSHPGVAEGGIQEEFQDRLQGAGEGEEKRGGQRDRPPGERPAPHGERGGQPWSGNGNGIWGMNLGRHRVPVSIPREAGAWDSSRDGIPGSIP